jgi:hypothetical protein
LYPENLKRGYNLKYVGVDGEENIKIYDYLRERGVMMKN